MPKKRQIPFLLPRPCADGSTMWHWKPSKRLREAGFVNVRLGADQGEAAKRAIDLNREVAAWEAGSAATGAAVRTPPRIVRFAELVTRYSESRAFTDLRPATQAEYRSRMRQLTYWALDGQLPVRDIDEAMVRDLRNARIEAFGRQSAAPVLRVLRLLLSWAVGENIIAKNPATGCKIPEPVSRKVVMGEPVRDALKAAALAADPPMPDVALAIDVAFWTLQRQGDVLGMQRFAWRRMERVDPRHAKWLVDPKGRVMAFYVQQNKTSAQIVAPVPPELHKRIEDAMTANAGGHVFAHPNGKDALPDWMFQRRFRAARDLALATAKEAGQTDLAEQLAITQFRDLRRTGMTFYGLAGAKVDWITALSGHAVLGRKTILDTYMPGNPDGAIACVATGLEALAARAAREEQA
ncbi:hypothetical protein ACFQ15_05570 [Sphingomonas hankookensis]|uniref:hypothetical protein n=1 Tax=Sphingomonas hankookensis TaxID=563996 RepID=UPI001F5A46E2|nr:hypothetical protein [Sphingomonas hankookensis]